MQTKTSSHSMKRGDFMPKYANKMDEIVDRICWETRATYEGATGMPLEISDPVERFISFNRPIGQQAIDFGKSMGVIVENIPESDGIVTGYVKFTIPMKVLRHGTIPPLTREQENTQLRNKLRMIEQENLEQEDWDRRHNLGAFSY